MFVNSDFSDLLRYFSDNRVRFLAVAGTLAAVGIAGCQVATPTPAPVPTSPPVSLPSASATATMEAANASRDATERARHFARQTRTATMDAADASRYATERTQHFARETRVTGDNTRVAGETATLAVKQSAAETSAAVHHATSTVVAATAIAQIAAARRTQAALPTPAIVYLRGDFQKPGEVAAAGVTGGPARVIAKLPTYNTAMGNHDVHPASGLVVYAAEQDGHPALWASMPGQTPRKLVEAAPGQRLESPRISPDGYTVAYARHGDTSELRLVGVDRSDDRQLSADTQTAVAPPFRLAPLGWSGDGRTIYLKSTSDTEATPKGLHEVDVATGTLRRAQTPDEVLWHASLSPDGNHLAYASWAWAKDKDSGLMLPAPPYRLRVTDLRTGETKTVLESQKQRYGGIVWSPEGQRLMVDLPDEVNIDWRPIGVDLGTGQTWHVLGWVDGEPTVRLTPQVWLPGERVLFTDPDGTLHLLDLDDERWQQVDKASEVEVMGYRLPAEAADPRYDPLIEDPQLYYASTTSNEVSPDGQWVARLFLSAPLYDGAWHRSQLRVERVDGSQSWIAIDEYMPHAVCGIDMATFGWSATGDYLFGRPGCGEGCGPGCCHHIGTDDVSRLHLADGLVTSAGTGYNFVLSPDGRQLASLTYAGRPALTIKDLASGEERSATIDGQRLTTSQRSKLGGLSWSPDGRYLAVAEVFGDCSDYDESFVPVLDTQTMSFVYQQRFVDPVLFIDRWLDAQHLQLRAQSANFEPDPRTRVIEIPSPP
jgi:WD40 repeat protein